MEQHTRSNKHSYVEKCRWPSGLCDVWLCVQIFAKLILILMTFRTALGMCAVVYVSVCLCKCVVVSEIAEHGKRRGS